MSYQKIDVEESIDKQRVVSITSSLQNIDEFLIEMAILLPFPLMGGAFVFFEIQKLYSEHLIQAILFFTLAITYGGLIGYSIINNENLIRVEGKGFVTNRATIIAIAKENKWKIAEDKNQLTLLLPKRELLSSHWERTVVIYDQKDILVNSIAYGSFDIKSPFHWFGNREVEKEIIEQFNRKMEHVT